MSFDYRNGNFRSWPTLPWFQPVDPVDPRAIPDEYQLQPMKNIPGMGNVSLTHAAQMMGRGRNPTGFYSPPSPDRRDLYFNRMARFGNTEIPQQFPQYSPQQPPNLFSGLNSPGT